MTDASPRRIHGILGLTLLVWLVAALHAVGTVRVAQSARSRNAARAATDAQLATDVRQLGMHGALRVRLLDAVAAAPSPFDFRAWLAADFADVPVPVVRERRVTSESGWVALTVEAEWSSLPLTAFGRVVSSAESRLPPVRLASVSIDPLAVAGTAKVTATFETIAPLRP